MNDMSDFVPITHATRRYEPLALEFRNRDLDWSVVCAHVLLVFPPTHPGEIVVSGRPLCDDRPRARLFVLFETPTLSRATEFTRRTTGCS